jgi:molybdopterin biosynthesis enzyme
VRPNWLRHEFVRARTRFGDGTVELEPLAGQESHMVVRAAQADALVSVAPGDAELPAGTELAYLPLDR